MGKDKEKEKKKEDKKKKSSGGGFWLNLGLVTSLLRTVAKLGIPVPEGILDKAGELLETTGVDLDSIKDKAGALVGSEVADGAGDTFSAVKDSGVKAKDVKKAAKAVVKGAKMADSGSDADIYIAGGGGPDSVDGISIETFAKIGAEMGSCGQDAGCMEEVLKKYDLNMAKYQKIMTEFTNLMQKDTDLAQRYSKAFS